MSKDKFVNKYILRKKAPKGVDPEKHERCVQDVKRQGKDVGSAHAICTASMKKAQEFAKNFKKSYDYRDHAVSVDAKDHQAAENADPVLVQYIKNNTKSLGQFEVTNCDFVKGRLVLTKKDEGLFNGFFKDSDGQIIERFDDQTVEMIAKNLMIKNLYEYMLPEFDQEVEEKAIVKTEEIKEDYRPMTVSIRCGDFELELRKSLNDFVKNWKTVDKQDLTKSINIWKKSAAEYVNVNTTKEAAKELLENWEMHSEKFNQILFAVQQLKKDK